MTWLNRALSCFERAPILLRLGLILALMSTTAGWLIYQFEPKAFSSWFEGFYWSIVTASNLGYGDLVPKSLPGRILAMLLILIGFGFVYFFVTTLAGETAIQTDQLQTGRLTCHFKQHIVIIGWNSRAEHMINHLHQINHKIKIAIIDETLSEQPMQHDRNVQWVYGNAQVDQTLRKANIEEADMLFITADHLCEERDADARSSLTILTAKSLNPTIFTAVEILTPEQKENAMRAGADEVIDSTTVISLLLSSTFYHEQTPSLFMNVLTPIDHQPFRIVSQETGTLERSFRDVINETLTNKDELVIGIKRAGKIILHPSWQEIITDQDELLVLNPSSNNVDSSS